GRALSAAKALVQRVVWGQPRPQPCRKAGIERERSRRRDLQPRQRDVAVEPVLEEGKEVADRLVPVKTVDGWLGGVIAEKLGLGREGGKSRRRRRQERLGKGGKVDARGRARAFLDLLALAPAEPAAQPVDGFAHEGDAGEPRARRRFQVGRHIAAEAAGGGVLQL